MIYPQDALALDVHQRRQADANMAHRSAAARRAATYRIDDHAEAAPSGHHRLLARVGAWVRGLVGTLSGRRATPTISTLRRA